MFAAIFLLFMTVVFAIFVHMYKRRSRRNGQSQRRHRFVFNSGHDPVLAPRTGLEPSIIQSLPVVVFHPKEFKEGLECAVCLCELSQGEKARLLPKCNHGFHLNCIDMWFQSHSTCPLCRTLVVSESHEIQVPEVNPEDGNTAESSNFPTNILVWGTTDQVTTGSSASSTEDTSSSSSSSTSTSSSEGNGILVIDIPRQVTQSFSFSTPSSAQLPEEELKSPTVTRLRSLTRLLSREKREIVCSPTGVDVEEGRKVQSPKVPSDS